jgi:hypothetical protein
VTAVSNRGFVQRSNRWVRAVLLSTLTMTGVALVSSLRASDGPSDVQFTVPLGVVLMLLLAGAGLFTVHQLRSKRGRPCFRPASLIAGQACVGAVIVGMQYLGYLGAVVVLIGGAAAAAAMGVSWTYVSDGEGVAAGCVSVCALGCVVWFAGRADERPVEGVVAVIGVVLCAFGLYRLRRRWRSAG